MNQTEQPGWSLLWGTAVGCLFARGVSQHRANAFISMLWTNQIKVCLLSWSFLRRALQLCMGPWGRKINPTVAGTFECVVCTPASYFSFVVLGAELRILCTDNSTALHPALALSKSGTTLMLKELIESEFLTRFCSLYYWSVRSA